MHGRNERGIILRKSLFIYFYLINKKEIKTIKKKTKNQRKE